MRKSTSPKAGIHIRKLRVRGRVLRDLIHGGGAPVIIDEVDADADIGGDVINTKRRKRDRTKTIGTTARKTMKAHVLFGALSIASMVAASGAAHALGWG